jgi:GH15 family glucan-1,4-alpha-glucosidase
MNRALLFANGELAVGLDSDGLVNQLYFPHIGSELHTRGLKHRIGVWVDGELSWLDSDSWSHKLRYPYSAAIGHTVSSNERLGILLEFENFVDHEKNIFVRNIHLVNLREQQRSVRLFVHQAFTIGDSLSDDTAQYLPLQQAILHYCGRRAFVCSGATDIGQPCDQHSIGRFGDGFDGTWRDCEDGELMGCDVERGKVDSVLRFSLTIGALSSRRVHYWLTAGTSVQAAILLHDDIKRHGVIKKLDATNQWWHKWLSPGLKIAERLPSKYRGVFNQSLMSIRSHTDQHGAIVTNADACSPQAALYCMWPLIRLGYRDDAQNFFMFLKSNLTTHGFLLPSYRPDGSIGSSNLPYDGDLPPLRSSDTALALFVLAQVVDDHKSARIIKEHYTTLIVPMANWLSQFTDGHGLPRPSYERDKQEITTYQSAVTYAALMASVELAEKIGDQTSSVGWRAAAEDMYQAIMTNLCQDGEHIKRAIDDESADISALFGAFMFGLFDVDNDIIQATARSVEEQFRRDDGLFASHLEKNDIDYIGSLRMAQYYIEVGRHDDAERIVSQVIAHLPDTDKFDVSEVWLRAELASTLLDTLASA